MIHGVLHLIGYKDKREKDKKTMFLKEQSFLRMFSSNKSSTWNKKNNV
jgi:ssRNA-specific RNase YbeY (16S rRNA maturation enzyme)